MTYFFQVIKLTLYCKALLICYLAGHNHFIIIIAYTFFSLTVMANLDPYHQRDNFANFELQEKIPKKYQLFACVGCVKAYCYVPGRFFF